MNQPGGLPHPPRARRRPSLRGRRAPLNGIHNMIRSLGHGKTHSQKMVDILQELEAEIEEDLRRDCLKGQIGNGKMREKPSIRERAMGSAKKAGAVVSTTKSINGKKTNSQQSQSAKKKAQANATASLKSQKSKRR